MQASTANAPAVRISYGYSKKKSRCCLRSGYIRCISSSNLYPLLCPFTSFVGSGGQIVCHPSGVLHNVLKGCISVEVHTLLPNLTNPQGSIILHVVRLITQVPSGSPDVVPALKYYPINNLLCRVQHFYPWLEVHLCACLSSYWLKSVTVC